jgi:serine/threonine kinase 16
VHVFDRSAAGRIREDAETHCTAPYRCPELYEPPVGATLDERVDVWSLGAVLYFMVFGVRLEMEMED